MVAAALSVGLLWMGIPQMIDSIMWRSADVDDGAAARKAPHWVEIASAESALLEKTDDWLDDPAARIRAGVLQLDLAYAMTPGAPDRALIARATENLSDGLARAPANGNAWAMLGYGFLAAGDQEGARRALRASLLVADFDPSLAVARSQLGLEIWPELDENDRRMVSEQLRDAWVYHPNDVVALAKQGPMFYWVAGALAEDPAELSAFLNAMNR